MKASSKTAVVAVVALDTLLVGASSALADISGLHVKPDRPRVPTR
jgi:hypothetical protein